jgi:predicted MFS family arabinose efflux permease
MQNPPVLSRRLTILLAGASGVAVANIYYNQPMLAEIAATFHVSAHQIGYVTTATQIGYAAGMPLFIPLGDFVERRRLVVCLLLAVSLALSGAALSPTLLTLVLTSFLIGATTVIAPVLIPLATELSPAEMQGRVVGTLMSGVILGILLARTLSGLVAAHFGWRAMFWLAAGLALSFAAGLRFALPEIPAHSNTPYRELMHSIWRLAVELPKLRQVSAVAGMFFAAFSAFWTTLVFLLQTPPYHYGAQAAGMFGLVGAVGASAAPISGRLSDRHGPRFVIRIAIALVLVSFGLFWAWGFRLWALILGVIVLDAGAQAAQVANQTRVLTLRPAARSRVNTIYMIGYFSGGSLGSLVGSAAWSRFRWTGVCLAGVGFMLMATLILLSRGPEPANGGEPQRLEEKG